MIIKSKKEKILFNSIGVILVSFVAILCVLPFIMVLSGSFSSEDSIYKYGYQLIPPEFSIDAYQMLFNNPETIINAYMVTIGVTVLGTIVGLFLTAMTAYVLQRKDFKYRNFFALYIYFTTLFSAGLVPWYLLIYKYLHLKDSYLALILPLLMNVFYIIIMRNFMKSIPEAIVESAKIDGANEFIIFIRLVIPMSKPALATVGLFIAMGYWNDWYNAMLFIQDSKKYPLQYFLTKLINSLEFMKVAMAANAKVATENMPTQSFKLATTVVVTGPIVLLYPFLQKYFIKGITIGAVKG